MQTNLKDQRENIVIGLYQYDLIKMISEDETIKTIINEIDTIDNIISSNLFNYHLDRLSFIDRAIVRLATYELKFTETPTAIIIDEAIILTKKFTDLDDEKQHKFNNRLLENINKSLRG